MKMEMTVLDMLNVIGKKVKDLEAAEAGEEREIAIEDAQVIQGLAKNFFIGANIAIEKERLQARYKVLNASVLDTIVGGVEE